jgi:hypothetical protein
MSESSENLPVQEKIRVYASVKNPSINAALKSLYSFENKAQAQARLAQIKHDFVTSKQSFAQTPPSKRDANNRIILWVHDYALTPEERNQGYVGNFAMLAIGKKDADKFTISATKINSELKFHPQRKRPKNKHPDWGHPILRDIHKKRLYFSLEEASHELARLHEEYPEVSIPDEHRLFIIVYGKELGEKPFQKYKFTVRPLPDGTFIIEYKENVKKQTQVTKIAENTDGYFSQKEKIRRTLKQKRINNRNANKKALNAIYQQPHNQ